MRMINLFKSLVDSSESVVITTHIHPDADGIGSEIALCYALNKLGLKAICVNEVPLLQRYRYLDPEDKVISHEEYQKRVANGEYSKSIDLFVVTDTNTLGRIGHKVSVLSSHAKNLLFLDHHPAPRELVAIHCIDTTMASTGQLVGTLIHSLGLELTNAMALALYTATLIDTSSFRYPTVTGDTHRLLASCLDAGVKPPEAYNHIYGTKKIPYMQMLGRVLSNANSTPDGGVAWISIKEEELEKYDVDTEDTHGFINHLLILDNIKVAAMFRQIDDQVKISFRSAGKTDVGVIAQALGGGGHDHSAATILEGTLEETIKRIIPKIELMLEN